MIENSPLPISAARVIAGPLLTGSLYCAKEMSPGEPDPMPLYTYAVEQLNPLGLAYLHFIEPRSSGAGRAEVNHQNVPSAMVLFRPIWKGVLITAGGFTGETADAFCPSLDRVRRTERRGQRDDERGGQGILTQPF